MKIFQTLLFLTLFSPLKSSAQTVWMNVAGNTVPLKVEQTQTETKPGWKIVDIKLKDKLTRYLVGTRSTQLTDNASPTLLIYPNENETLTDYALMRLRRRRQFRQLITPQLEKNEYTRFLPEYFDIQPATGIGFACTPKTPLEVGEYIVVYLPQKPVQPYGDYMVYPFSIRKE